MNVSQIAFQYTVCGKTAVVGEGFQGREAEQPYPSLFQIPVYLNGEHDFPLAESAIIRVGRAIGLIHPYALIGMPDIPGELKYRLAETQQGFILFGHMKLSEAYWGPSEGSVDWCAAVARDAMAPAFWERKDARRRVLKAMLWGHFRHLFSGCTLIEELEEFRFKSAWLEQLARAYFREVILPKPPE